MSTTVRSIDVGNSYAAYYAAAASTTATETIHISGQPGSTKDGTMPADYASQVLLALVNIHKIIIAANASITDIVKLNLYIVNYDAKNRLHAKPLQRFLGKHRPAVTLIPVQKLAFDGWLFEVDAVLAKHTAPNQIPRSLDTGVESVDVVIIGAGLAGLTAAREVIRAGLSCIVLEARDRVGGRTYTHKLDKGIIDLGAAWINDTNQSQMFALVEEFKLELVEQNTTGNAVLLDEDGSAKPFPYGELPPFDETTKSHLAHIRDTVEADCQKLSAARPTSTHLDSMTFTAYLKSLDASPLALSIASIWTRAMIGQEPEDISALFFLNYCKSGGGLMQMRSDRKGGGQHLRIRTGTQSFCNGLAASLPAGTIRLSTPVSTITQLSDSQIAITTLSSPSNPIHARKVVTSIPPPALQHLTFTPPLPPAKRLLLESFHYGFYQKVMLVFRTPFWTTASSPNCGLINSFSDRHPSAVVRDTSSPLDDKHILTFFAAGDPGRAWAKLPKQERETALIKQAADAFCGGDTALIREQLVKVVDHLWNQEHWNGYGCPSPSLGPGVWDAIGDEGGAEVLAERVGGVHFVGTETSDVWRGYMEGAVRSGRRGAEEVLVALKGKRKDGMVVGNGKA